MTARLLLQKIDNGEIEKANRVRKWFNDYGKPLFQKNEKHRNGVIK